MLRRKSQMRGDFRFERATDHDGTLVWEVQRRTSAQTGQFRSLGIARVTGSSRHGWEGVVAGTVVCPKHASREQVAYCLLRESEKEDAR